MPRHRAGIEIVAAADVETDHELDALADVEVLRAARPAVRKRNARQRGESSKANCLRHLSPFALVVLELSAPPGQRSLKSVAAPDFLELLADLGRCSIKRRAHVEACLQRVAKA